MDIKRLSIAAVTALFILSGCSDSKVSNQAPVVNLNANRNDIKAGQILNLDANASDSDGQVVSYEWKEGDTVLGTTEELTYTSDTPGKHTLSVTITDDKGAITTQTFVVIVKQPNQPPVANAGEDRTLTLGETVQLSGTGSDSDGNITSYSWKEGNNTVSDTALLSYTPSSDGIHSLTFSVTDNDGATSTDQISINVLIPNKPPVADAGDDKSVEVNKAITLTGIGNDSDGEIVSYVWKEGELILANTAVFSYIPTTEGLHALTLIVTDDKGAYHSDDVVISVRASLQKPHAKAETKATQWYIRLLAENISSNMKTVSTQLGELEEENTVQKHTLKALTPFGGRYVDIVFKDPEGVKNGEYKVNFHRYKDGEEDKWRFTIKTDKNSVNDDILLSWRGVYVLKSYQDKQNRHRYSEYRSLTNPIIKYMKLIDTKTGKEMPVMVDGKVQTYSFNMNGEQTRTFEWIVQTKEVTLPTKDSKLNTSRAAILRKNAKIHSKDIDKSDSFDLSKPPMIKEDLINR